jgi:hypothetical protein
MEDQDDGEEDRGEERDAPDEHDRETQRAGELFPANTVACAATRVAIFFVHRAHARRLMQVRFLTLDKGAWHVRAAALSAGVANRHPGMCGSIEPWWSPPTNVIEEVVAVSKKLDAATAGGSVKGLVPWLSADRGAQMFGSAPDEQWTGGAAIKKVFESWQLDIDVDKGRRSGIGPGGDLMWLALSVSSMHQCTNYRVLVVLAKEKAGWKIVHQQYSEALRR